VRFIFGDNHFAMGAGNILAVQRYLHICVHGFVQYRQCVEDADEADTGNWHARQADRLQQPHYA